MSGQVARDVAPKYLGIGKRVVFSDDAVMVLSQSDATAAVLEPKMLAHKQGAPIIATCEG